jgi:hypothetical protein
LKGLRKSCLSNELSRFISLCAAGLQDKWIQVSYF